MKYLTHKFSRISLCTAVMNRLPHIQQTLIKNIMDNINYPFCEFVVLDYNSNDGLEDWLKSKCKLFLSTGRLRYYRTEQPKYWHMSHAKNCVHKLATGKILCNVDADNFIGRDFVTYLNSIFSIKKNIVICGDWQISKGSNGRIAVHKQLFEIAGGYDEKFMGWGVEEEDFTRRLKMLGCDKLIFPEKYLTSLDHSDQLRLENYRVKIKGSIYNESLSKANLTEKKFVANLDTRWGKIGINTNFGLISSDMYSEYRKFKKIWKSI